MILQNVVNVAVKEPSFFHKTVVLTPHKLQGAGLSVQYGNLVENSHAVTEEAVKSRIGQGAVRHGNIGQLYQIDPAGRISGDFTGGYLKVVAFVAYEVAEFFSPLWKSSKERNDLGTQVRFLLGKIISSREHRHKPAVCPLYIVSLAYEYCFHTEKIVLQNGDGSVGFEVNLSHLVPERCFASGLHNQVVLFQNLNDLVVGSRFGKIISLNELTTCIPQEAELIICFHSFCKSLDAYFLGHLDNRRNDGAGFSGK